MNHRLYDKIKNDVENYLSPKPGQSNNPPPQVRREALEHQRKDIPPKTPDKLEQPQLMPTATLNFQRENKLPKQPSFDGDTISINGTKITGHQIQVRLPPKKKELVVELSDASEPKYKFELKLESTVIDIVGLNSLHIKSSKLMEYKNNSRDKKLQWLMQSFYTTPGKENAIVITFPPETLDKGSLGKHTLYDKLLEEEFVVLKNGEYVELTHDQKNQDNKETEDNDDKVEFRPLTKEDLTMVQRIKKNILQIKQEDKVSILTDVFKIKKEFDNPLSEKRLKCPILNCQKTIQQVPQLKAHLKKYHPQLSKNGIELNDQGVFEHSQRTVDFALIMAKIYPSEVKKIIKRMKTKQAYEA